MRLGDKEFRAMGSWWNELSKRYYEFAQFKRLLKRNSINLMGKIILDAGCGAGFETEVLAGEYRPEELYAFDVMPEQVEIARDRGVDASFFVGSVTDIDLPDEKFDAVFVFGILHHVPRWRDGVREIHRVLKPGGFVLLEEPHRQAVDFADRVWHFSHPEEGRFDWGEFEGGLAGAGLEVVDRTSMVFLPRWRCYLCRKS